MKEIVSSVAAGPAKPAYQAQPLGGAKPQPAERQDVVSANALPTKGQAQSQPVTEEAPLLPDEQEKVEKAVEDINDHFQSMGRDLSFAVDEDSGRTIITVFDSETQEIVRQIPPEEVLDLAMNLVDAGGVASTGLAEKV